MAKQKIILQPRPRHHTRAVVTEITGNHGHLGRTANGDTIMRAIANGHMFKTQVAHLPFVLRVEDYSRTAWGHRKRTLPAILIGVLGQRSECHRVTARSRNVVVARSSIGGSMQRHAAVHHEIAKSDVMQVFIGIHDGRSGMIHGEFGIKNENGILSLTGQSGSTGNAYWTGYHS